MGRDRRAAAARGPEGVGEIAVRQAILHALVVSGIVEATLGAWGIRRAESRLRFWLLAIAFPFLVLPLLLVAAPMRLTDRFAAGWALFASERWTAVRVAGIGADAPIFGLLILAGTLLFLRDVVPFLTAAAREYREERAAHADVPPALSALVGNLAADVQARGPAVVVLRTDAPTVFVRGVLQQTLVLSDGVLARLSADQLKAAMAHELAHVRFRDPLAGWLLMAARLLMFWNPAVQLTARAIVQEMEHRADAVAAQVSGAQAFAEALRSLAGNPAPALAPASVRKEAGSHVPGSIELFAQRLHHAHISARVASVLATPAALPRFMQMRLALVGVTLGVLVFFIV
jgi:Zn-dependent protease with chaperone function